MTDRRFHLLAPRLSPVAQRVALALSARGTALEWQAPPARDCDAVILTVFTGKGQATALHDLPAMIELIEDLHPEQPLHPRDPDQRALHRELIAATLRAEARLAVLVTARNHRDLDLAHHFLHQTLRPLERGMEAATAPARPRLCNLDVVLAPLLWRITVLDAACGTYLAAQIPRLAAFAQDLLRQPPVAALLDEGAAEALVAALRRSRAALCADTVDWSRALGAGGRETAKPSAPRRCVILTAQGRLTGFATPG